MTSPSISIPEETKRKPRLILASASPRRQELLREAGYEFLVVPAEIDESRYPATLLPAELARLLAAEKARAIASQFPDDCVLGADTVVAFGDRALGKPSEPDEARRMLGLLAGTTHIVITGVALICRDKQIEQVRCSMSSVRMRALARSEIDAYIAGGQWRGKAGGYGIQDRDPFVTNTAGSHSNIVGLPMEMVIEMLHSSGIQPQR